VTGGISPDPERSLDWVDRSGEAHPVPVPTRAYMSPRLSPDGSRIVVWTQGDRTIWEYDLARGALSRVTSEGRNARVVWTPDGRRLAFASSVAGDENAIWMPADGSGRSERLTICDCVSVPAAWSPDGRMLAVVETQSGSAGTDANIQLLTMDGERKLRPFLHSRFSEAYPDISPDGRWIAYASNESGQEEVYVQSFPNGGARHQISTSGGAAPAWSHDGRELFYITAVTTGGQAALLSMMSVRVTSQPTFSAGTARVLFQGRYGATALIRDYDVSADGRRFLMVRQKERPPTVVSAMVLVQNWLDELKRKVPAK
jgi:serine/threonine-protein kinase